MIEAKDETYSILFMEFHRQDKQFQLEILKFTKFM